MNDMPASSPENVPAPTESKTKVTAPESKPAGKPLLAVKLWLKTFIFGLVVMSVEGIYLVTQSPFSIRTINLAVAGTSVVLISLSMALSGITYFWDFADRKIIYRKYLGVTGFFFALAHIIIAFTSMGTVQAMIDYILDASPALLFGTMAALVLLLMTFISNVAAARVLGNVWWRRILRLGYAALIFIVLHFSFLRYRGWSRWLQEPTREIPSSLLLVLIVTLVLLLRIALMIALMLKARNQNPIQPETPTTHIPPTSQTTASTATNTSPPDA